MNLFMHEKFLIKLFFSLMDPPTQHNNVLLQNTLQHTHMHSLETSLPFLLLSLLLSPASSHTYTHSHSKSHTCTLECRVKTTHATNAIQDSNHSLNLPRAPTSTHAHIHTLAHTRHALNSLLFSLFSFKH